MVKGDYESFLGLVKKTYTLSGLADLIEWDMKVMMSPGELPVRIQQLSVAQALKQEILASDKLGSLLNRLKTMEDLSSDQIVNVREVDREYTRLKNVPEELVHKLTELSSKAEIDWEKARENNDFGAISPSLKQIVELSKQKANLMDSKKNPYEVLLGDYDDVFTVADIEAHFTKIKENIVPLLKKIKKSTQIERSFLEADVNEGVQYDFCKKIAETIGYDFDRGRLDKSTHPFTAEYRITTRFTEGMMEAITATMHEAGHGMYEQGLPMEHYGTPLGMYRSLSLHESQSRLWENHVGLSKEFWNYFFPQLQESYVPVLNNVEIDIFYKAINKVEPNFIRTLSDEITYSLHIMLRTELEQALIEGSLSVGDLPQKWNEKMQEYLGITPPTDTEGVLQDPHWYGGLIGYFPTYTLGSMMSAQQFNAVKREHPDLMQQFENGEFGTLKSWLNENIHKHGRRYSTKEIIERATGKPPGPEDFVKYLEEKYATLYGMSNSQK